ncbi:MAG: amidohydrolase family protein [Deltaproteobacteria bacterium]|nr:amidohydrolase family protein [Deltaproteobacteria bacterium]
MKMHAAGIPIAAGTDSANWPLFLNYFHGASMVLELEYLQNAGMAPLDIVSVATRIPAEMMRVADRFGTVEEGKMADLIICKNDPLTDMRHLRNLMWVMKGGEMKTPAEWMN